MRRSASARNFDPSKHIKWAHFYWAEGDNFKTLGVANGNSVSTWPAEQGDDLDGAPDGSPVLEAAGAKFNNRSVVKGDASSGLRTTTGFSSALTYPITLVTVAGIPLGTFDILCDDYNDAANRNLIGVDGSTEWYGGNGGNIGTGVSTDPAYIELLIYNDGTSLNEFWLNGVSFGTATSTTQTLQGLKLFNTVAGVNDFNDGEIAFFGIYEGVFGGRDRAAMRQWVAEHYAMTISGQGG